MFNSGDPASALRKCPVEFHPFDILLPQDILIPKLGVEPSWWRHKVQSTGKFDKAVCRAVKYFPGKFNYMTHVVELYLLEETGHRRWSLNIGELGLMDKTIAEEVKFFINYTLQVIVSNVGPDDYFGLTIADYSQIEDTFIPDMIKYIPLERMDIKFNYDLYSEMLDFCSKAVNNYGNKFRMINIANYPRTLSEEDFFVGFNEEPFKYVEFEKLAKTIAIYRRRSSSSFVF
jgi:hypothetical protein